MRAFIAIKIELEPKLKKAILRIKNDLSEANIKWTGLDDTHLTLKFFKEIRYEDVFEIIKALEDTVSGFKKFEFDLKDAGVFPGMNNPRVLWIGIDRIKDLKMFYEKMQTKLKSIGYPKETRAFSPHLTIGRIKNLRNVKLTQDLLSEIFKNKKQTVCCKKICFYESVLRKDGPEYNVLKEFALL